MLKQQNNTMQGYRDGRVRAIRLIPHPSSFIPHPSSRSGLSLIEVLASIGVLTIGLLSLAALLPVGQVTIFEAIKADRAGTCGRAAMRNVVVRRMLDYHNWYDLYQNKFVYDASYNGGSNWSKAWFDQNGNSTVYMPPSFVIDPLGVTSGSLSGTPLNSTLGNKLTVSGSQTSWSTNIPRITLATTNAAGQTVQYSPGTVDSTFRATDDIVAPLPENMKPAQPRGRPLPQWDTVNPNVLQSQGDYTWFLSVSPESGPPTQAQYNPANQAQYIVNNSTRFTVSVVVCYRRTFNPNAEQAVPVSLFWDTIVEGGGFVAMGGGSVRLVAPQIGGANDINVRENDWVALCTGKTGTPTATGTATGTGLCRWYRVVGVNDNTAGSGTPSLYAVLVLAGPDWPYALPPPYNWPPPDTPPAAPSNLSTTGDMVLALGQDVVGVYTTTVDLDTDATWKN